MPCRPRRGSRPHGYGGILARARASASTDDVRIRHVRAFVISGALLYAAGVHALGVTIYEMLAGRPPHVGSPVLVIGRIARGVEPPPLTERCPGIAPEIDELVRRAIAPHDRHARVGSDPGGCAAVAPRSRLNRRLLLAQELQASATSAGRAAPSP